MINMKMRELGLWDVIVPRDIRYISEWNGYDFAQFPNKCIIDKQIPGCGYTEWCIRNVYNVILASPRKILLENKAEQHPGEVFLVKNENDRDPGVDKDLNKEAKNADKVVEKELTLESLGFSTPDTYNKIKQDLEKYLITRQGPKKILVTYDSYYLIKTILQDLGIFNTFYTVVDEMQSILHDARFKSNTELEFMTVLKDVEYVQFISATPMLEKYLKMLPDFGGIDIFRFNWENEDPSRVIRPSLNISVMRSINEALFPVIKKYKEGNFDKITVKLQDGSFKTILSDEAVFYVNSVNYIINTIKSCNLRPDEVNILCSRTPENERRIKTKLGKDWTIGSVPLKGEKPKMFTFCTRTVYLGADFYSTCAKSYIFSDSNSDCLAVDISQDLPQILGRQRLEENPWKNSAYFYYRSTADYRKMTREDFEALIQRKMNETKELLNNYAVSVQQGASVSALVDQFRKVAKMMAYKQNYIAVNVKSDIMVPVINDYVRVADIRAFDIQQIDYADRFSVFREIENKIYNDNLGLISGLVRQYDSLKNNISNRLKFICEQVDSDFLETFLGQLTNDDYAKSYYLQLGPGRCKALGYNITKIRKELGIFNFESSKIETEVLQNFSIGQRITKADAKTMLSTLYQKIGYSRTPKANDLSEWFDLRDIVISQAGKKVHGFELLKKK